MGLRTSCVLESAAALHSCGRVGKERANDRGNAFRCGDVALRRASRRRQKEARGGKSTILSKDKTAAPLPFHTDHQGNSPTPWPAVPFMGVLTCVLSDYSLENGPVCVVPGSHRLGCGPTPEQSMMHDHPSVKPLEVEAGSVILWHGSLWHASLPRTAEGRRLTLVFPMLGGTSSLKNGTRSRSHPRASRKTPLNLPP